MQSTARVAARSVVLTGLLALLAACGRPVDQPQAGVYRATLKLPGGDAPFGLEVVSENNRFVLYLVNATERTRVDNLTLSGGELTAVFAGNENSLRAKMYRDRLAGNLTLIEHGGKQQVIPFVAAHGETYRFHPESLTDNADLAGHWEMTLSGAGTSTAAVAVFEQQHDRITGTVMTPTGDHRFLEGQVRGEEAQLSTFAGGHAYLYKLKVNAAGELEGEMWQGLRSHYTVAAKRNDHATLESAGPSTQLKDKQSRVGFTFRDLDGNQVSLGAAKFGTKWSW